MSGPTALLAAPAAARALIDRRDATGTVELVLRRGAYLVLDDHWLLLSNPGDQFGPLSLVVEGIDELELAPGAAVRSTGRELVLGDVAVSLRRLRRRAMLDVASIVAPASPGARRAGAAGAAAVRGLPAVPARLRPGVGALTGGAIPLAVDLLAGLGEGLTPAGDDVLAGYAGARAAHGAPVALSAIASGRSSPLGLAYLRCAERGELPDAAARLLIALNRDSRGAPGCVEAAVRGLGAWGASSGIALGWGIANAIDNIRQEEACPFQDSGLGSTSSRTPRLSTSPRLTASSRSRAATTRSSTRS